MKLSSRANELLHAFDEPGCPVCRLTADSVHGYLDSLVYEYVNKPATHMAVRAARGFCTIHAWHALERINASGLGIALLYEGLVRNMLRDMGEVQPGDGRRQLTQAANALKPRAACPACEHRDTVENHLLRNLLEHLDQPGFAGAFGQSAGLCLPHLRLALDVGGQTAAKVQLVAVQQAIWGQLQVELAEYIRKSDYNVNEALGPEADSPRRAIALMAGIKNLR